MNRSGAKQAARVVIADEHRLFAEACKSFLQPEFEVVAVVTDGRALLEITQAFEPDIIIADAAIPRRDGLDATRRIKFATRFVMLTTSVGSNVAADAFQRGALALVSKHSTAAELITAMRSVLRGEYYLSPLIARESVDDLLKAKRPNRKQPITSRQREILQLLLRGMTMKEVAYTLGLAPGTVAYHKYRLMSALDINSNLELLHFAIEQNTSEPSKSLAHTQWKSLSAFQPV